MLDHRCRQLLDASAGKLIQAGMNVYLLAFAISIFGVKTSNSWIDQ
jgi:hypothetical protein